MRRSFRLHLGVLLLYSLAAVALTWPLVARMTTHVAGDGIDDPALAWNLWWIRDRLVDHLSADIFQSRWMFFPVGVNLAFYTLTPLNGLLSLPLQFAFGLVFANNVLLLSSFVLAGYGAFLLARWTLGQATPRAPARLGVTAALIAGFVYALAAPKLFYAALGQFNIASSQWIPFCVLYLLRLTQARTARQATRDGLLAGLFLLLQAWAELTFASFLLIFLALVALITLLRLLAGRRRWIPMLAGFATAGACFVVGILPFLVAMAPDLRTYGDFFASGGGFADVFSADLAGFLLPTRLHPWFGPSVAALPFPNDKGQHIYLGWSVLLLACAGAVWLWRRAREQAWVWLPATALFWALSLGPSLRWMGRDLGIPGPFALVSLLPFFNGNRYPSRYGVMLLLCVGVLAAAGWVALGEWLFQRRPRRLALATAALLALFAFEHLATPLPTNDFRIPPIYQRLKAEPGDLALLELPTGWRNGARVLGRADVLIMMQQWYQTGHGKRRLGGNTSRNPPQKFQYFTEHPLLGDLIGLMNSDSEHLATVADDVDKIIARHAPIAAQELADLGVGWVTLHEERATPALTRFVEEALPLELVERWQGSDWTGAPAAIRLYRVTAPGPAGTRTFDLTGGDGSQAAAWLADGWSSIASDDARTATSRTAHLVLPLADAEATLSLAPASSEAAPAVSVNGIRLASLPATADADVYRLPAGVATEPVDLVTLQFAGEGQPVTTLATRAGPVGTTGIALEPGVVLVVESAGEETGDFAHIWLNGVDVASGGRGYNLAALTPGGELLDAATFDTHASAEESARMAQWLRQWPQGAVIAGAIADEASMNLQADAVAALGEAGVAADLRGRFRDSHAFAGVAGAAPGSALEQTNTLRPARVWLGAPVDGARAWGPLNSVIVTPAAP